MNEKGKENQESGKARLSRARIEEILEEYREMHALLASWPARRIPMDYEKEWDEKRRRFLEKHPAPPRSARDLT